MFTKLAAQRSLAQLARRSFTPRSLPIVRIISPIAQRFNTPASIRFNSTAGNDSKTAQLKVDKPEMMIAFTCKKCDTRSSHVMSKQAYTSGTVLITCPGCKNRHLIADHLKVSNVLTD